MSKISKPPAKKILIVGGVAAGMSAAARARRLSEDSQIIVFERSGFVSFANCGLPYYLGNEITGEEKLVVQTPAALNDRFNLDVRVQSEVVDVDANAKTIVVKNRVTEQTYQESYDELILAVGAAPIRPPIPGIDLPGIFTMRSMEDVRAIRAWMDERKPQNVVVAGAGFIGLEVAEQFARLGMNITIVDGLEQVLAPVDPEMAVSVHGALQNHGIKLLLSSPIKEFKPPLASETEASVAATSKSSGAGMKDQPPRSCFMVAGENEPVPADMVILGLGIRPELALARKAGLEIGQRNGIRVNEYLQTSVANIWAVGDAIEVLHPVSKQYTLIALGGPANRQGRIVADNVLGAKETYTGTLGTAIVRVFDLSIAMLGLNEKQCSLAQIPYHSVRIHPSHHASYFPGAKRLDMKLLFRQGTGEVLGAQIIGKDGVDKRIDVLATAMKANMTVREIADLELAYAPPFGSAKDPINLIGMAAVNVLDGLVKQISAGELASLDKRQFLLMDVRSAGERQRGFIPESMHLPLPELRKSLDGIPRDREIIIYCQSGQRSYYACRFLEQHGFNVRSLSGGYFSWEAASANHPAQQAATQAQHPLMTAAL